MNLMSSIGKPNDISGMARIVVIDDDPNVRKTLSDILRMKGYESVAVKNGAEGIAEAERSFVNLVLIDLKLPDMSGIEVMEQIKAIAPLTEAIILTGNASLETAMEATNKGAFSYLLKPYKLEELLLHVRHGIERQRDHEQILRLASYPRLDPNPVIEINLLGAVTYLNPAAEHLFPDLASASSEHPLLSGWQELFTEFRQGKVGEIVREVRNEEEVYEEHLSYVVESDLVRIRANNITRRKQAEEALATRERQQAAVAELGKMALTGVDLQQVFERSVEVIAQMLRVDYCAILELLPNSEQVLLLRTGTGWRDGLLGSAHINAGSHSLESLALISGEPAITDVSRREAAFTEPGIFRDHGITSGIAVSIESREVTFGVLGAYASRVREFSRDDANFLQAMANVLAAAILRMKAQDALQALAATDSLTGIANRRAFATTLERELSRAKRHSLPLSLIMYDIDHFKRINDTWGHDVGDNVLQRVTEVVRGGLRDIDGFARWGGEEFLILAPHTNIDYAAALGERLRATIEKAPFEKVGKITASFGVTSCRPNDDCASLLKRVDEAVYLAKQNARNKIEVMV